MITITTNLDKTFLKISEQLRSAISPDTLLRHVAVNMLPVVRDRIHVEGLDAENTQIGTYSPGYMKVRTGVFATNEIFKKGKNKGATKPTGVFTKGKKKGQPRPQYNRTLDLLLLEPNKGIHGLWIELKVGKNKMSKEQKDFSIKMIQRGYGVVEVRSFEQFKDFILKYFS